MEQKEQLLACLFSYRLVHHPVHQKISVEFAFDIAIEVVCIVEK